MSLAKAKKRLARQKRVFYAKTPTTKAKRVFPSDSVHPNGENAFTEQKRRFLTRKRVSGAQTSLESENALTKCKLSRMQMRKCFHRAKTSLARAKTR